MRSVATGVDLKKSAALGASCRPAQQPPSRGPGTMTSEVLRKILVAGAAVAALSVVACKGPANNTDAATASAEAAASDASAAASSAMAASSAASDAAMAASSAADSASAAASAAAPAKK